MTSDADKIIKTVKADIERRMKVVVHVARGPNWTEEHGDYVVTVSEIKASQPKRFLQPRYWIWFLAGYAFSRFITEIIVWLT